MIVVVPFVFMIVVLVFVLVMRAVVVRQVAHHNLVDLCVAVG